MLFQKFRSGSPANQALLRASRGLCGPPRGCLGLSEANLALLLVHLRLQPAFTIVPPIVSNFEGAARSFFAPLVVMTQTPRLPLAVM